MMKKYGILFSAILIFAFVFTSWSCRSSKSQRAVANIETPENIVTGNRIFALNMLRELSGETDNYVYSPYSISSAMSMIYAGAAGKTASEIKNVLCFPAQDPGLYSTIKELNSTLTGSPDKDISVKIANAVWLQKDYHTEDEWSRIMKEDYQAPSEELDYISPAAREKARSMINKWTADNTGDKIKEIIPEGILNENTRLVLTNALYFKGKWMNTFNKAMTRKGDFHKADGSTIMASFMNETSLTGYYCNDTFSLAVLPYEDQDFNLQIILPGKGKTTEDILNLLTEPVLTTVQSSCTDQQVELSIPSFTISYSLDAKNKLMAMGLKEPFGLTADLSGINGNKELMVDDILHKAFIEVNEDGTEAAAATAAVIGLKAAFPAQPVIFKADHPFIFLLTERKSGTILFAGVVNDPTQK